MLSIIRHYLAITALGGDRIGVLAAITKIARQCGCNISESKSSKLGDACSMMFLVNGSWGNIAKIEAALPSFAAKQGLDIQLRRTSERQPETAIPYQVEVSGKDRTGILNDLAEFFSEEAISIIHAECDTYLAKNTTTIVTIQMQIDIPAKLHIASVRERFMMYCEAQNLDAMIEPHK